MTYRDTEQRLVRTFSLPYPFIQGHGHQQNGGAAVYILACWNREGSQCHLQCWSRAFRKNGRKPFYQVNRRLDAVVNVYQFSSLPSSAYNKLKLLMVSVVSEIVNSFAGFISLWGFQLSHISVFKYGFTRMPKKYHCYSCNITNKINSVALWGACFVTRTHS